MSAGSVGATTVPFDSQWQASLWSDAGPRTWPAADDVLEHDIGWLLAQCDRSDKRVLVVDDGAGKSIPFFVHDGQIDFNLGEFTFASRRVRRHVLVGNFTTLSVADWNEVFEALHRELAPNAAVFLMGVVAGEALEQALAGPSIARRFLVSRHGPTYDRRLCRLGADLEAYLSGLASGRRQDLRRSLRRFEREFEGRFEFRSYTEVDELGLMLDAVEPVSARTYQARLRGLSLSRRNHSGREVIEGAKRGIARCYLLSVDGRPVAWRIGFLYRGVYYSHHIGYEPDFERWHPGVVLHLKSVADLSENVGGVRILDMLYGDNEFKRKASNLARTEAHYYLFARTVPGRLTHAFLSGCDRLSRSLGEALERRGLKAKIKRWIRRY
ncbi:MAG: GNAT family N-acetyltransferase [Burkholderiaceae bacterium]|jgi:CelD/BcsL family acetyltransferase involved in cellulose biosynthesis|nr:GNAT family N-acetyltransferase [Burkholderiaceae bacterium]